MKDICRGLKISNEEDNRRIVVEPHTVDPIGFTVLRSESIKGAKRKRAQTALACLALLKKLTNEIYTRTIRSAR